MQHLFSNHSDAFNYMEIILLDRHDPCVAASANRARLINIHTPEPEFKQMLQGLMQKQSPKERIFKRFRIHNMTMDNQSNTAIAVYSKDIYETHLDSDAATLTLVCSKKKQSAHMFPSTHAVHDEHWVRETTFRFHNRLYLNFEEAIYPDATTTYKIYINYNHDTNTDLENMQGIIKNIVQKVNALRTKPNG